ncbi:MAG: glutamine-hydrolyzing GMP synthase [Gammaproteobacteria bacterium]|nr:glutamine-hydrolyzing GMP synthase [Gammaproteobacteria bacterium]
MKKTTPLIILDFGSQYSQLIARRVRELGVYCELYPHYISQATLSQLAPSGIILSGGPESVGQSFSPKVPDYVFELGVPVLGICYGMQAMAAQLGGQVASGGQKEFGLAKLVRASLPAEVAAQSLFALPVFENKEEIQVWMSHGDHVTQLPPGFYLLAQSEGACCAAMMDPQRRFYGVQFHPEVTHTPEGKAVLAYFVHTVCGCELNWQPTQIIPEIIQSIREQVNDEKVLMAFSGGVDSSVAATLLHQALGDKLHCIFIDTGLLRLNEVSQVKAMFEKDHRINLTMLDASERFLSELQEIDDPEQKRKTIGRVFIEIFEEEAQKHRDCHWLAQGTIYSDVIESAGASSSQASHVIKSHHNVGGLPADMNLKLIEPLRELFKDEVRQIGLALGLPHAWLYRHPFPGAGLGIRMMCPVTQAILEKLRLADAIFIEELQKQDLYYQVSQAFAVYLPVNSVGVVGDARQYAPVIALRAVKTDDFMTAHWAELPYSFLSKVAHRIVNEVPQVSRVVYDITGKPPATIEWE